jgi:hypothetical protein
MIASGWRTAPPQSQLFDSDAVLVTNSRCPLSLEAMPRVPDLTCVALPALLRSAATAYLAPVIVHVAHTASASHTLSAPTVSQT